MIVGDAVQFLGECTCNTLVARATHPAICVSPLFHFVARTSFHTRRFPENAAIIRDARYDRNRHLPFGSFSYGPFQPLTVRIARRPSYHRNNNNNVRDNLSGISSRTNSVYNGVHGRRRVGVLCFIRHSLDGDDRRRLSATRTGAVCIFVILFLFFFSFLFIYRQTDRNVHAAHFGRFANKITES